MKKYLKTIEDIEALRNTDTKMYKDNNGDYYKFVNGVPCFFGHDSIVFYNVTIDFDEVERKLYIEVEDEPSEDLIGKLGIFSDDGEDCLDVIDILMSKNEDDVYRYQTKKGGYWFKHFRPLTPEEVEEYTGYKVVEEK